jgi:hypothetical protein
MNWKDKADMMQGIAGAYWLFILISFFLTSFGYDLMFFITFLGVIPLILSLVIIMLREDEGIDIFGIFSFITALTIILLKYIVSFVEVYYISFVVIATFFTLIPISAVGLLLEAFDIIKPIKYKRW